MPRSNIMLLAGFVNALIFFKIMYPVVRIPYGHGRCDIYMTSACHWILAAIVQFCILKYYVRVKIEWNDEFMITTYGGLACLFVEFCALLGWSLRRRAKRMNEMRNE